MNVKQLVTFTEKKITNSENLIFCSVLLLTIRNLGNVMIRMMNCFVKCISLISIKVIFQCVKSVQIRSYFWSIFSCIWTEYEDLLRVQFECRKIGTRNNSVCGHFSHSVGMDLWLFCKGVRI